MKKKVLYSILAILIIVAGLTGCTSTKKETMPNLSMKELFSEKSTFLNDKKDSLNANLPDKKYNIVENVVNIDFKGQNMVATLTYPESKNNLPIVLMLHGFMSQRNELPIAGTNKSFYQKTARIFSEQGYATLRIDFIGSGESDGLWKDTTISNQVANAETALAYIKTLSFVDTNRIAILGLSQGGMVGALTASRNPEVKSLILWSPVSNPYSVYSNIMGEKIVLEGIKSDDPEKEITYSPGFGPNVQLKSKFFKQFFELDPLAEIGHFKGSLQVVVGEKDTLVTPQPAAGKMYLKYHPNYKGQKEEFISFTNMDHVFNVFQKGATKEHNTALVYALSFLNETLK